MYFFFLVGYGFVWGIGAAGEERKLKMCKRRIKVLSQSARERVHRNGGNVSLKEKIEKKENK